MLDHRMRTALTGGGIAVLAALAGTAAPAQENGVPPGTPAIIESPAGETAIVPGAATLPGTPAGAVAPGDYPLPEQLDNDASVIETLIGQGFTDVHILREGPMMTVNAQRDGRLVELVYSVANGTLVSVDGQKLRPEPEPSGGEGGGLAAPDDGAAPDPGEGGNDGGDGGETDSGADEGSAGDSDGGAGGDAGGGGADGGDAGGNGDG